MFGVCGAATFSPLLPMSTHPTLTYPPPAPFLPTPHPPPTPCGHHLEAVGVVKDVDAPGQGVDDLVAGEAGPAAGVEVGGDLLALRVSFPPHPGHVGAAPPVTCTRPYVARICVCPLYTHLGWGGVGWGRGVGSCHGDTGLHLETAT